MPRKTFTLYSLRTAWGVSGSRRWLFEEVLMNSYLNRAYVVGASQFVLHLVYGELARLARPRRIDLERALGA